MRRNTWGFSKFPTPLHNATTNPVARGLGPGRAPSTSFLRGDDGSRRKTPEWAPGSPFGVRCCGRAGTPSGSHLNPPRHLPALCSLPHPTAAPQGKICFPGRWLWVQVRLHVNEQLCIWNEAENPRVCQSAPAKNPSDVKSVLIFYAANFIQEIQTWILSKNLHVLSLAKNHNGSIVHLSVLIVTDNSFLLHLFHHGNLLIQWLVCLNAMMKVTLVFIPTVYK